MFFKNKTFFKNTNPLLLKVPRNIREGAMKKKQKISDIQLGIMVTYMYPCREENAFASM